MIGTLGSLLVNAALPQELRDASRRLDKKTMRELLRVVAVRYPDQYKRVVEAMMQVGRDGAYTTGATVSLDDLREPPGKAQLDRELRGKLAKILDSQAPQSHKREAIRKMLVAYQPKYQALVDADAAGNAFAEHVRTGARGSSANLLSLRVGDVAITDPQGRVVPVPILQSYARGLSPMEFWAASYGARQGVVNSRLAVRDAGDLWKQLNRGAHRLVVSVDDCGTRSGIEAPVDDEANYGAFLSADAGPVKAGTMLNPSVIRKIKAAGIRKVSVRSPITCEAPEGLCKKCVGVLENGQMPPTRYAAGLIAAQALGEQLQQSQLSARHSGGVVSAMSGGVTGFDAVNQVLQAPARFPSAAAVAPVDGVVSSVKDHGVLGKSIVVGKRQIWAPYGARVTVKSGQQVNAGDVLSTGLPNPREIAQHKGLGAARLSVFQSLADLAHEFRIPVGRRQLETIARAVVNHVRITDPRGYRGYSYGAIVPYDLVAKAEPRQGAKVAPPRRLVGMYLEAPAAHYTIGTKLSPGIVSDLERRGVKTVVAHSDEPAYTPHIVRLRSTLLHDPDWMTRLSGTNLKTSLLDALYSGSGGPVSSAKHSTSYVPALAAAQEFGHAPKPYYY